MYSDTQAIPADIVKPFLVLHFLSISDIYNVMNFNA